MLRRIRRWERLIINGIGRVVAQHFGFPDEEFDCIINYDLKYRVGRDADEGDEGGVTLDTAAIERLIQRGESLAVEFKTDRARPLPDREIYEAIVCFANAQGGVLLIGIENDGTVSGPRRRHESRTDPQLVRAAIFNNTVPPINTRVSVASG